MGTMEIIMRALASALTGTWRSTGRFLTDAGGNTLLDKKGKPRREFAICAPESVQEGEAIVVHKSRTGELAVFVLTHRIGWRDEAGKREGLWRGQRVNPFTGQPLESASSGAVVTLDGDDE